MSSKLPSEVRAGRRRLEPGHGVPSPSPRGIQARRWLSCPCPPGSALAPGGTGTPFGISSVSCLPIYSLTWAPSLILCAFLMWKQPNILGFLGHISFECSVPLLPPRASAPGPGMSVDIQVRLKILRVLGLVWGDFTRRSRKPEHNSW